MAAPGSPTPPRHDMWRRVLLVSLRRLGLPLLSLVVVAGIGLLLYQRAQPTSSSPPAASQGAQPQPQQPGAQPGPAPPRSNSELRVLLPFVATLDPGLAYDSDTIPVVQLLFEGLLAVDEHDELIGRGAQKWEVSPDGLVYTFHLNPQARWSDGQVVTARDYVFAWRRNVDPRTGSPYGSVFSIIKNGQAIQQGLAGADQLAVQARDDQTLVVTMELPATHFPWLVATWTYFPLRADLLQRFGNRWSEPGNLVGNGPYLLETVREGPEVVLARNAHYVGPEASMERIIFRGYQNYGEALAAFRNRELDVLPYSAVLKDAIAGDPLLERAVRTYPRSGTTFVVLNNRRQALQDERVRRALGMAIDRASLVNNVEGGAGEVATSLHPDGIDGRDPSLWPRENMAEARRLLAEAGYPNGQGLELVLAVPNVADRLGEALQQRWKDTLGITVRLAQVDDFSSLRGSDAWRDTIDMYVASWQSDYEDPYNWFNLLWDSRNDPGQYNSGWSNQEFDRLVRAASAELNTARRRDLYHQAEGVLGSSYPLIPLYHQVEQYLVRPEVQGFNRGRTALTVPLLGVRLSTSRQI